MITDNALSHVYELAEFQEQLALNASDDGYKTQAEERMQMARTLRQLANALNSANDLCRSTMEIAKRDGKDTNWDTFRTRLTESLNIQQAVIYPAAKP